MSRWQRLFSLASLLFSMAPSPGKVAHQDWNSRGSLHEGPPKGGRAGGEMGTGCFSPAMASADLLSPSRDGRRGGFGNGRRDLRTMPHGSNSSRRHERTHLPSHQSGERTKDALSGALRVHRIHRFHGGGEDAIP